MTPSTSKCSIIVSAYLWNFITLDFFFDFLD